MKAATHNDSTICMECIACGSVTDHRLSPLAMKPELDEFSHYHVATCIQCGLASSYPIPDSNTLSDFYGPYKARMSLPMSKYGLLKRMWHAIHDQAMLRLVSRYKSEGLLLDVGAGNGRFAQAATNAARWNVVCSELSPELTQTLKNAGLDARCGDIDNIGIANGSVDVIWVSHVFEHLPRPIEFLTKAQRLLKSGGILVLLVPSTESLRARLNLSAWHHVNPPGHLWSFRPGTVRALLSRCGFVSLRSWEVHAVCECVTLARKA